MTGGPSGVAGADGIENPALPKRPAPTVDLHGPVKPGCACASEGAPHGACSCAEKTAPPAEKDPKAPEPMVTIAPDPPPLADGWELEEQLRHIERMLSQDGPHEEPDFQPIDDPPETDRWMRLDAAHASLPDWHPAAASASRKGQKPGAGRARSWGTVFAWSALSLGSMAFACGGVLLGWSVVADRADLWSIGMPVVLIGQLVLLMGFILQLDRLWHEGRDTSDKLEHVDQRLDELKTTTSLMGTSHASGANRFYSHLAGGANPQLLLTDLKSQLDLLALKMSQVDR